MVVTEYTENCITTSDDLLGSIKLNPNVQVECNHIYTYSEIRLVLLCGIATCHSKVNCFEDCCFPFGSYVNNAFFSLSLYCTGLPEKSFHLTTTIFPFHCGKESQDTEAQKELNFLSTKPEALPNSTFALQLFKETYSPGLWAFTRK